MNNATMIVGDFQADLPEDFGVKINRSIADVREPWNRNGEWSHTITLPGTKANRVMFSHLFELDSDIENLTTTQFAPDFNPNIKAPARYLIDEVEQLDGFLRLLKINILDENTVDFECTVYGKFADFKNQIFGKLNELDFSEFNHTLTFARISESWDTRIQKNGANYDNFGAEGPTGEGYVYGLGPDDGSFVNYYGNTNVSQFYPQLYVKQVWDKIFDGTDYTYSADSFPNTQYFKQLTIPCPTGMELGPEDLLLREFEATRASGQVITTAGTQLTFPVEIIDAGNNYDDTASEYESAISGGRFNFYYTMDAAGTGMPTTAGIMFIVSLYVNGSVRATSGYLKFSDGAGNVTADQTVVFNDINLQQGDIVIMKLDAVNQFFLGGPPTGTPITGWTLTCGADELFYNKLQNNSWGLNGVVDFAAFFNDETEQLAFFKSICNLFNLYIEPVPGKERELYIQTRDDFYDGDTEDWTELLDKSQPLEITPMGELDGNPYYFTMAPGEDQENKDYKTLFSGRNYGDKKYFVDNDFIKNEKVIDVIFAPTQLMKADGYDKVLSYVPLVMDKGTGQLRILYYGGLKTCSTYQVFDNANMTGSANVLDEYPLTLHLDDPDTPTEDLNFGIPFRVNLPAGTPYTNNNLFNKYWSKYMTEITDPNSAIVAGYFYLSPATYERISFRKKFFFERNYFVLNKIDDYDPQNNELTRCEFLRLKDGSVFSSESGTIGGDGGGMGDGEGPPHQGQRKMIDGNRFGLVGVQIGRDNGTAGEGALIVGDRVAAGFGSRNNTALGSDDAYFVPGASGGVSIQSPGKAVDTGELYIQGYKVDIRNPDDLQVIGFDLATETWRPVDQAAGANLYEYHDVTITGPIGPDITGMHLYGCAADGGAIVCQIPTPLAGDKCMLKFKKMDATANTITLDPVGAEQIDGVATKLVSTQYDSITIMWDGVNTRWLIV